jgi:methionine-rich copper-binding protein CopC
VERATIETMTRKGAASEAPEVMIQVENELLGAGRRSPHKPTALARRLVRAPRRVSRRRRLSDFQKIALDSRMEIKLDRSGGGARYGRTSAEVLAGLLFLCATMTVAEGQAATTATEPTDAAIPSSVRNALLIEFNEPVLLIRVRPAGRGGILPLLNTSPAGILAADASARARPGVHAVSWRATSEDGHEVTALTLFTVGLSAVPHNRVAAFEAELLSGHRSGTPSEARSAALLLSSPALGIRTITRPAVPGRKTCGRSGSWVFLPLASGNSKRRLASGLPAGQACGSRPFGV